MLDSDKVDAQSAGALPTSAANEQGAATSPATPSPREALKPISKYNLGRALLAGARNGDYGKARMALELGADPDAMDAEGDAVTHLAVYSKNLDLIAELSMRGANMDAPDCLGRSALGLAVHLGRSELIHPLLAAGASQTALDEKGKAELASELAMMEAAGHRRPVDASLYAAAQSNDMTKARMALALGASPNATTPSGYAPIHAAVDNGSLPMVKLLAQAGADLNLKDAHQLAPLHQISRYARHAFLVTPLIELGADPNIKERDGETPLHFAANTVSPNSIKALIAGGADVNMPDCHGMVPLARLVSLNWSDPDCFRELLASTDLLRLDKKGRSLAEIAYEAGNPKFGAMIEEHAAAQERAALSSPGALADTKQATRSRLRM